MELLRYNHTKHQEQLESWYLSWNQAYNEKLLPQTGVIVEGYCALFLYNTDTALCFVDGFIRNKAATGVELDRALDLVVGGIVQLATDLNYHVLCGQTRHAKVLEHIRSVGCVVDAANYTAYYKRLV